MEINASMCIFFIRTVTSSWFPDGEDKHLSPSLSLAIVLCLQERRWWACVCVWARARMCTPLWMCLCAKVFTYIHLCASVGVCTGVHQCVCWRFRFYITLLEISPVWWAASHFIFKKLRHLFNDDRRWQERDWEEGCPLNLGMMLPHCKYPTKNYMKCHVAYYAGNISRGMIYIYMHTFWH